MAKREVMMLYGEKTVQVNYRVPESKKDEIDAKIKGVLKGYENLKRVEIDVRESEQKVLKDLASYKPVKIVLDNPSWKPKSDIDELADEMITQNMSSKIDKMLEKKSNPADIKFLETTDDAYDGNKVLSLLSDEAGQFVKLSPEKIEELRIKENLSQEIKKGASAKKVVDMDMLRDIAAGKGLKTSSFTTVKKPIDEIYDCIIVEKGIPAESDRIYYGANNRIAFWDRDDASVYYANWENKYYQFANSKEFNKFCKENQIK